MDNRVIALFLCLRLGARTAEQFSEHDNPNIYICASFFCRSMRVSLYRNLEFELKIAYVARSLIACNVRLLLVPSARIFYIFEMRSRMSQAERLQSAIRHVVAPTCADVFIFLSI